MALTVEISECDASSADDAVDDVSFASEGLQSKKDENAGRDHDEASGSENERESTAEEALREKIVAVRRIITIVRKMHVPTRSIWVRMNAQKPEL